MSSSTTAIWCTIVFLKHSSIAFNISRMLLLMLLLQFSGPPILTIFSNRCTGSIYRNALNTKIFPPRISSSSLLLHVICVISSQSSLLDPLDHCSSAISWLQSQDHKLLFLVCRTSLVEQASSYSLYSLSVQSFIITQLFSIVILWSWTGCWPFLWHFPFLS